MTKRKQPDGTFRCTRCGSCKPVDAFCRAKRGIVAAWCKSCRNSVRRKGRPAQALGPNDTVMCTKCARYKTRDSFHAAINAQFGVASWCKECCEDQRRAKGIGPAPTRLDHPDGLKICNICLVAKELREFQAHKGGLFGVRARCRRCAYKNVSGDAVRQRDGVRWADIKRNNGLIWRYGITLAQYEEMKKLQDHLCAICGVGPAEHLDHHHATKKLRKFLCNTDNIGIGSFGENLSRMTRAQIYLARHNDDWAGLAVAYELMGAALKEAMS
jgi:hypothetical protein